MDLVPPFFIGAALSFEIFFFGAPMESFARAEQHPSSGRLLSGNVAIFCDGGFRADHFVPFVQKNDAWPMSQRLLRRKLRKIHDGEAIANFTQMGRRTVQLDRTTTAFTVDHISFKTSAICHVSDKNFFVRQKTHAFGKIRRNR